MSGPSLDQGSAPSSVGADPRRDESEPGLVQAIRDEILAAPGERITFARFMERALTEPGLGYYATSSRRPTRSGDFLTAPELHPFFGRCVARLLEGAWRALGQPERLVVREWGAGRGTLAADAQAGLVADGSPLAGRVEWQPVDLTGRHPEPPAGPFGGVGLANELLDALPVHRVGRRDGRLVEYHVTWQDGWFAEVPGEPSTPALAAHLAADGVDLAEGQRAEVGLAATAWPAEAAAGLERGWLLLIDYGHPATDLYGPRRFAGTLRTYRGHEVGDDPYRAVGRQDITAHVDVTALRRAAAEAGLAEAGETSQARFLAALGLGDMLTSLGRDAATDVAAYVEARAAVARLLDPRHLGAFRVMAWSRGVSAGLPLPGFEPPGRGG